jgi:hypothetical protein
MFGRKRGHGTKHADDVSRAGVFVNKKQPCDDDRAIIFAGANNLKQGKYYNNKGPAPVHQFYQAFPLDNLLNNEINNRLPIVFLLHYYP